MDTNSLKKLVAKHFDYAPHGTGQLLHGEWFTPKHQDSLEYLLDEIGEGADTNLEGQIEDLQREANDSEKEIARLTEENARLEKELEEEAIAL